ncbi:MAG: cell division protein ZapA [Cellulosilyticaceae bacterium]
MTKNKVEVIIGGNIYALQGEESGEHIQQVAAMIDKKIAALHKNPASKKLSSSQVHMLAAINIGDEYLKAQKELQLYAKELEKCNEENMALMEKIEELGLEITRLKTNTQKKYK